MNAHRYHDDPTFAERHSLAIVSALGAILAGLFLHQTYVATFGQIAEVLR